MKRKRKEEVKERKKANHINLTWESTAAFCPSAKTYYEKSRKHSTSLYHKEHLIASF
jgi:hypothetical protein